MDSKQVYLEARLADAKALEALRAAKAYLYQTKQTARKVPKQQRGNWTSTIKLAEDRLNQAKRRAAQAEATLIHAWGFYQATLQEARARRAAAKKAHQAFKKAA